MAYVVEVKRKKGIKYKVVWYENGEQTSKTLDTKREANAFRKQKEAEVSLGIAKKPSDRRFGEYAKEFIINHTAKLKPTTQRNYIQQLNLFNEEFENTKIVDMTTMSLNKYFYKLQQRNLKMNTIRKYRDVLKLILNAACSDEIIISNPMDKLTFKFIEERATVEEIKKRKEKKLSDMIHDLKILLDSFEREYYKHFLMLGYMTGMRKGELLALRWHSVDFDNRKIHIEENLILDYDIKTNKIIGQVADTPKTASSIRTITMHDSVFYLFHEIKYYQDEMKKFFGKQYRDNNLVICKQNGEPMNTMTVSKTFYEKNKIYGTEITPHKLRHMFASKMAKVSKELVQQLLGHTNKEMTEHYQDIEEDNNDENLEIMNSVFKDE